MATKKTAFDTWSKLSQVYLIAQKKCKDQLRNSRLTQPQYEALAQLHLVEGIPLTQVARNMNVTGGNVTGIIDRLVRDGFVNRARHKRDRRVVCAHLTAKGRKAFAEATPYYSRFFRDVFGRVSESDLKRLQVSLERVSAAQAKLYNAMKSSE